MGKRCLVIGYYFYPDSRVGAKRFNLLTHHLSKKNDVLDILTIDEDYIPEKDYNSVYGGEIYRTSFYPRHRYKGNRLLEFLNKIFIRIMPFDYNSAWIIQILLKGKKIIQKDNIDTIIVTGPPFSPFIAAYILSKIYKLDLIIDYQDPWYFDDEIGGRKFLFFFEKFILKAAKKIIFNTETAKEAYLKLDFNFSISGKSFVLNNPYFQKETAEPIKLEKNKKVIVYAGNFYGLRRLKYIFQPLLKLYGNEELLKKVSIHIFGPIHPEDLEILSKIGLTGLVVEHPRIEYTELVKYLKGADLLYLSQGADHCFSVPYKLIDYLTIERPILAVTSLNSATYKFMKNLDCGYSADIDNTDDIFEKLSLVLNNENNFTYKGIEKYSYESIADDYYKIINRKI